MKLGGSIFDWVKFAALAGGAYAAYKLYQNYFGKDKPFPPAPEYVANSGIKFSNGFVLQNGVAKELLQGSVFPYHDSAGQSRLYILGGNSLTGYTATIAPQGTKYVMNGATYTQGATSMIRPT
jgi:hypothetical protein